MSIDRANLPVKDALRLTLGQVGLTYRVEPGYVRIIADEDRPLPVPDDPLLIVGHSWIALFAAGFGGVAAPLVAGARGRQSVSD